MTGYNQNVRENTCWTITTGLTRHSVATTAELAEEAVYLPSNLVSSVKTGHQNDTKTSGRDASELLSENPAHITTDNEICSKRRDKQRSLVGKVVSKNENKQYQDIERIGFSSTVHQRQGESSSIHRMSLPVSIRKRHREGLEGSPSPGGVIFSGN